VRPGLLVVSLATLLVAHAAGGAVVAPPQTVVSADGLVTVSVPAGATTQRVHVRKLAPSQLPKELRGAKQARGAALYALTPDGLRFAKPVRITRRIDAKQAGFDLRKSLPGVTLVSRDSRGRWAELTDQRVEADGRWLVVSGATRHFSTVVSLDLGLRLVLEPDAAVKEVGDGFRATVRIEAASGRKDDFRIVYSPWGGTDGIVKLVTATRGDSERTAAFRCVGTGKGSFGAPVHVEDRTPAQDFMSAVTFQFDAVEHTFLVQGAVECTRPAASAALLRAACVLVTHTPLGSFPSFLSFVLGFAPSTLPQKPVVEVTAAGVNNGAPVSAPVDSTGRVRIDGGISSFGAKLIQVARLNGADITAQLVDKVGASIDVTSQQGTAAGTCP
jgi:hypothetical protein